MSVELRGPLKHNPVSSQKNTPFGDKEPSEEDNAAVSSSLSSSLEDKNTTQKSEWEWTGVWSFGSLRTPTGNNHEIGSYNQSGISGGSSSNRKVASKRMNITSIPKPFHYKFVKEKDPLLVEIPSGSTYDKIEDEKNEDKNDGDNNSNKDGNSTQDSKDEKSNDNNNIIRKETFGSGKYYRDANSVFPTICPKGGSWTGYFENVLSGPARTRDKKSTTRVEETFYLFFNAKPPPNAKTTFDGDYSSSSIGIGIHDSAETSEGEHSGSESGNSSNKPSKVHVRGMGTNLFGTFEILGWLDVSTKILHCQRRYLPIQQKTATTSKRVAHRKSIDGGTSNSRGGNTERKYFTRKKIMSWQRPTDSDEEKPQSMRGLSGGKKRQRSISQSNLERTVSAASATASTSVDNTAKTQESSEVQDSAAQVSSPSPVPIATAKIASVSDQLSSTAKSAHSLAAQSLAKKKSLVKDKIQPKSIHLPPVADSMEARWRSAHYIFYQRITNPSDDAPSSPATTTTTTCIYEGQFLNGYGLREGYGVCLYPNGNIYEGGFRRNKESGFGTLYSGDRKKIFYAGDWDRGKMHGRGKYYYYYADSQSFLDSSNSSHTAPTPSSANNNILPPSLLHHAKKHQKNQDLNQILIGVYQGDFKENVRHGYGTYTLPDGSIYDGEFVNNLFSGKGTFTWPDGSIYTGSWKDGKRHGSGLLKSYDGFTYEGQWSNNAMDGRGTCVYPDNQRYEGLFVVGKKEGRGTIRFTNGAIYEGRFKDDSMEGQGTMKMNQNVAVGSEDWMIPIEFQSDMEHIHLKAGFDHAGS